MNEVTGIPGTKQMMAILFIGQNSYLHMGIISTQTSYPF